MLQYTYILLCTYFPFLCRRWTVYICFIVYRELYIRLYRCSKKKEEKKRRLVFRASTLSHPSTVLDPLCTRTKLIALTLHAVRRERKKDPFARWRWRRLLQRQWRWWNPSFPKSQISSQSAYSVNANWMRPGVVRSRLRSIYKLFAVSSRPGPGERERERGLATDDDFSVTWQLCPVHDPFVRSEPA